MTEHRQRKHGTAITPADAEVMADDPERGYDVDTLLRVTLCRACLRRVACATPAPDHSLT